MAGRQAKKLVDLQIRNAQAKEKDYKMPDGSGLYLLVKTTGSKYWRFDYRFGGKRKTMALGVYPSVDLKSAREALSEAKKTLSNGTDPAQEKRKASQVADNSSLFSSVPKARKAVEIEMWFNKKRFAVFVASNIPGSKRRPQSVTLAERYLPQYARKLKELMDTYYISAIKPTLRWIR